MRRMTQREAMMLVVGLALAVPARAQAPLTLTLEDAVARGVAHAPRVAAADAQRASAAATVTARQAQERPLVSASGGLLRTNHVDAFGIPQPDGSTRVIFPDIPTNYDLRGEVDVPVYTGGRADALIASAQADLGAASADRQTTAADVALEVATAYWSLVTARDRIAVIERALTRADASLADARARVDAGLSPPNDVLSAQAQRARQNVLVIEARNDADLAEAQLARLIGAPPGAPIVAATPVTRPTPAAAALVTESLTDLATAAANGRPERQALLARQSSLQATAAAALAAMRPQVSAVAALEPARPNQRFVPRAAEWNTSWDLGIRVTWSLWDGGRSKADQAVALAQADAVAARVRDFDEGLTLEARQRLHDLASTQAALAASAEAVSAATEARRVLGERFAAGVATSTELLAGDVALLEAELEQTNLQASLRITEARLVRTVGGR